MANAIADALALTPDERAIFIIEADAAPSASDKTFSTFEHLLTLAENSFHRYPDVIQQIELDQLDARFDEISAAIVKLMRTDVHKAQRFAGVLCEFWQKRSRMSEGSKFLEQALLLDVSPSEARAYALLAAGTVCACQNEYVRGKRHIIECLHICAQLKLTNLTARATHVHAWILLWGDQQQPAGITTYEAAIQLYEQAGDSLHSAHARCDLGLAWIYGEERNFARAEACVRDGLDHFLAAECPSGVAFAQHALAQIHIEAGRYGEAEHHESQALVTFRRTSSRRDVAWSLAHLGEIAQARGRPEEAKLYWEEALTYFFEINEHNAICVVLHSLARIARETGDMLVAQQKIIAGLHITHGRHRPYVLAHGLYELAGLQLESGNLVSASTLLGAADALVARMNMRNFFDPIPRFSEWRRAARDGMGQEMFAAAAQRGAEMSIEELIALASTQ